MDDTAFTLLLLIVVGVASWAAWWMTSPGRIKFQAPKGPREVTQLAIQHFTSDGWTTTTQVGYSTTFTTRDASGCMVGLIFLVLGVLPGLIYYARNQSVLNVAITANQTEPGNSAVVVAWNRNWGVSGTAGKFRATLVPYVAPARAGTPARFGTDDPAPVPVSAGAPMDTSAVLPSEPAAIASAPAAVEAVRCLRCGETDLRESEKRRDPVICNDCLAALRDA
jgi:hypothetical protein